MLKSLKKKMKDQAGLTLIELLVVIVILGIIAAIAIPMVMSNKDKAEINTNLQTIAVVEDAVNRYETVEGTPPASLAKLVEEKYIDKEDISCAEDNSKKITVSNGVVNHSCKIEADDETDDEADGDTVE